MERVVGKNPPFHVPVFVLTHYAREPVSMEGGTTFTSSRDGIRAALVDTMHVPISPMLLGSGESLFAGLDLPALGYKKVEHTPSERAMDLVVLKVQAGGRRGATAV